MLDIDADGGIEALRVALQDAEEFTLVVLVVPVGPAREEILRRLDAWSESDGVPKLHVIHLDPGDAPFDRIARLAAAVDRVEGVVLTGLERHLVGERLSAQLTELNLLRDSLSARVQGPFVVLGDDRVVTAIARSMPDFYSWRAFELPVRAVEEPGAAAAPSPLRLPRAEDVPPPEIEHLRTLLEKARSRGGREEQEIRLRLAYALIGASRLVEGESIAAGLSPDAAGGDERWRARLAELRGHIAIRHGDAAGASAHYLDALERYERADAPLGVAGSQLNLGDVAHARSDFVAARGRYERALALYRTSGDPRGEAHCLQRLGDVACAHARYSEATGLYEEAAHLFKGAGDLSGEATCFHRLGVVALQRSDHARAQLDIDRALALYRQSASALGEANCLLSLGLLAHRRMDPGNATACFREASGIYRTLGDALGEANCARAFGDVSLASRDLAAAGAMYARALDLYRAVHHLVGRGYCLRGLADVALLRSEHDSARTQYEEAMQLLDATGDRAAAAVCALRLGDLAVLHGDDGAARENYDRALPVLQALGHLEEAARCLLGLGQVDARRGDRESARRRSERALTLFSLVGDARSRGFAHHFLAQLTEDEAERRRHITAARDTWRAAGHDDLIAKLLPPPSPA